MILDEIIKANKGKKNSRGGSSASGSKKNLKQVKRANATKFRQNGTVKPVQKVIFNKNHWKFCFCLKLHKLIKKIILETSKFNFI